MLSSLSWADFIAIITITLTAYYLIIGLKFYSREFRQMLSGIRKFPLQVKSSRVNVTTHDETGSKAEYGQPEMFQSYDKYAPPSQQSDPTFQQVETLTASLKEAIAVAVSSNYGEEEFVFSLQRLLKNYQFIKNSPHLVAINNLIASECEKYGYIQLSAEEQVMLWNE